MVSTSPSVAVQEKEVYSGFPSFSKYTVSVVDAEATASASITISSSSSGQSLVIPVTLIHVADPSSAMKGQISVQYIFKLSALQVTTLCTCKWVLFTSDPSFFPQITFRRYFSTWLETVVPYAPFCF